MCTNELHDRTFYQGNISVISRFCEKKTDRELLFRGKETVLIIDDEEAVIKITQKLLKKLGYKTITADSGESAIEIYKKKHEEIDLIILDLGMPGMGGRRCLEILVEFDPQVKVVIASGYSDDGLIKDNIKHGAKAYAIKPYTLDEISKVIRKVLVQS